MSSRIEEHIEYYEGVPVALIGYTNNAPTLSSPITGAGYYSTYISTSSGPYYNFLRDYVGADFVRVPDETIKRIRETQVFMDMPIYPLTGSIAIIDDVLVVKLGEYENFKR